MKYSGKKMIGLMLGFLWIAASQCAFAACTNDLKLEGVLKIQNCKSSEKACLDAEKAIIKYSAAQKIDPTEFSISMHASPWHLYGGDMRITPVEELAEQIKPELSGIKRIVLKASWSGVAPNKNGKSLAQRLSDSLDGFPVNGMDGFVWIAKDGSVRTTHQAWTGFDGGVPYEVHPDEEVMVSFAAGWPVIAESTFIENRFAEGIMRAGAAWDIYLLCPEKALVLFEYAAALSHPIAAYNAALLRLERGKEGDISAAKELLSRAAALGDKKAKVRLQKLNRQGK